MASLPPLRTDLELIPAENPEGERKSEGWLIYDGVRNRYFRISRPTFLALSFWEECDESSIAERVSGLMGTSLSEGWLDDMIRFLQVNQLLKTETAESIGFLKQSKSAGRKSAGHKLIHGYLFFKIPLVRPDHFLTWLLNVLKPLLTKRTFFLFALMGVTGLLFSSRQWDQFLVTADYLMTPSGVAVFMVALIMTKIIHELGHGLAAKKYGCRVPTMGVAFLVMFPVLYTDTTDAWRLPSRQQRLVIGAAGMMAELTVACVATFLWIFIPEGTVRSAVFMLATVTWITSLAVNLNPFMRFDGYYLLSDYWHVENLQGRAFALARWQLREWLFKWQQPMPEAWSSAKRRQLIFYAYGTWIYRFFLFMGIALLVYHFFFKVLGIVLFLVEILWFILLPIYRELSCWWTHRKDIKMKGTSLRFLVFCGVLAGILFYPLDARIEAPAEVTASDLSVVYAPSAGLIRNVSVNTGDQVQQGDPLIELTSPDLEHELAQTGLRIDLLNNLLKRTVADTDYSQSEPLLRKQLAALGQKKEGLLSQQQRLVIRAPVSGRVTFKNEFLRQGRWLNPDWPLLRVVKPNSYQLQAYIDATELNRLAKHAEAVFYPDDMTRDTSEWMFSRIEAGNNHILETHYLNSEFGGPLLTSKNSQGQAVLSMGYYKAGFVPVDSMEGLPVMTGQLHISAGSKSIASSVWSSVSSVLVRESGF